MKNIRNHLLACTLLLGVASCQTVYYGTMEKVGVHKRDIMVDRVKAARDAQADSKEEFKDALELFSEVVTVEGGSLEKKYNKLKKAFERSEDHAQEVRDRVAKVESVSGALFKEWRNELGQYSSAELRRASERKYDETQRQYEQMISAMNKAADSMDPVLDAFRDQVLFLKHNLNARAIASIQGEARKVERDVARLIKEMEASIAEADTFIRNMGAL